MKNIHLLPTDKPSRLAILHDDKLHLGTSFKLDINVRPQNIYITSDEEIKKRDWFYNPFINDIQVNCNSDGCKKIILTTDQDLIKDGVQAIDYEFLEWFVKNPSCEKVEVESFCKNGDNCPSQGAYDKQHLCAVGYKIIIPKEELTISDEAKQRAKNHMSLKGALEPKQETLEEAAENHINKLYTTYAFKEVLESLFIDGAKWQAERMYSEEELKEICVKYHNRMCLYGNAKTQIWFEQIKKK